jgi:hypothetical protein
MAATYEPIASVTISGTSTNSTTFSSIPGTYTDLLVLGKAGTTGGANSWIRFNGDTGTNYSATMLRSTGSSALSTRRTNENGWLQDFQRDTAVTADVWQVSVMNYANTSVYKTALGSTQSAQWDSVKSVGLWRSTSAISSLTVYLTGSNFTDGSTFSLYGIKAA